ncbi:MAG: RpiB/LacA/LacB family sugar-phosphate isomerase [Planctomycetota bacterium]
MNIALGGDHRGHAVLVGLIASLEAEGHTLKVFGSQDGQTVDYPDTAFPVARAVASGDFERGILVCGSGIGSCIAANKIRGVRAALAHDELGAEMARRHHDANILCLAADLMGGRTIERVVEMFLISEFEGGRHARRLDKITAVEDSHLDAVG